MMIKVTDKILSIPPHISTSWSRIAALHVKGGVLAITLIGGEIVQIPNLDSETIQLIFQHHAVYLEKEQSSGLAHNDLSKLKNWIGQDEPSIRLAFGSSVEGIEGMMQHNPSQSNSPDLPPEILQKIGAISKIIAPSDEMEFPKAESGCNCFFCQIARALNPESQASSVAMIEEPSISDEDLHFQEWDIKQIDGKLYSVTHRLDGHEKYNVYLGEPVGCTCGKQGCEHILAVLKS